MCGEFEGARRAAFAYRWDAGVSFWMSYFVSQSSCVEVFRCYARSEGVDVYNLLSSSPRDLGLFTQHVVKERARICITALAAMPAGSTLPEGVSIKLIRDFRDELLALVQDMIRLPDGTRAWEATFESFKLRGSRSRLSRSFATARRDRLPLGMPRRMSLVYGHPSSPRTPAATLA
jgi:hypothetical protein